ncbi:MAG: DUF2089 domain-containing protein [Chloroflexi bacterium]|nr:DUF2089 domain-containing protein [Chloroflexota bacterium]
MYPVIGRCPVCGQEMEVSRLYCRSCDSSLEGHFALGKFYHLTPEQLHFVEIFVKCEGKIKDTEDELGISYPTVRAKLREVIRALGYEVPPEELGPTPERRKVILDDLAAGKITADEAARLLRARG